MSEINRRFRLYIDEQVAADLERVKGTDSYAYKRILVFLQEVEGGEIACQNLVDRDYADDRVENVSPFWHLQNQYLNVHRVKLISIGAWRIITAGDYRHREIAILAIMHRDQDYENDKPFVERLKESYERLCFSRLGR